MNYGPLFEKIESQEFEIQINVVSGFAHLKMVIKEHEFFKELKFYSVNHKFFNLVISNRVKKIIRSGLKYDIALCFYLLALIESKDTQYKQSAFDEVKFWCGPYSKKDLYWTEKIIKEMVEKNDA